MITYKFIGEDALARATPLLQNKRFASCFRINQDSSKGTGESYFVLSQDREETILIAQVHALSWPDERTWEDAPEGEMSMVLQGSSRYEELRTAFRLPDDFLLPSEPGEENGVSVDESGLPGAPDLTFQILPDGRGTLVVTSSRYEEIRQAEKDDWTKTLKDSGYETIIDIDNIDLP